VCCRTSVKGNGRVQDAIKKMEEYNLGMKNAVQLWDATVAASNAPARTVPASNAHPVVGGSRSLTGSEARTILSRCAPHHVTPLFIPAPRAPYTSIGLLGATVPLIVASIEQWW
jgi:hypothetical protein